MIFSQMDKSRILWHKNKMNEFIDGGVFVKDITLKVLKELK